MSRMPTAHRAPPRHLGRARLRRPAWAALLACLPALPCAAQDGAAAAEVVISATRTERRPFDVPASVDRLGPDALREGRPQLNLTEGLALVPGVAARDRQNFAQDVQLSIRGFGTRSSFGIRGLRVYVDGIPATLPDGQGQVSHIDLASADRVEVLRGPFSALYGNSSGGVVQVFTEDGQGPPSLSAGLLAGSDGLHREQFKASGAEGTLSYVLSASRFVTDGAREHAAARRDGANVKLRWQPTADRTVTLVANHLDQRAQDPLGLTRAQFDADPHGADAAALRFDTRKTTRQTQAGLVWRERLDRHHELQAMAYAGTRSTVQFQAIPVAVQGSPLHPGGVIDLDRGYHGGEARWTWRPSTASTVSRPFSLVAGLAWDRLDEDRRGFANFIGPTLGVQGALRRDERNRASSLDPFVQAGFEPTPRWRVEAGVRHNTVRVRLQDRYVAGPNGDDSGALRYAATSPALGVLYRASERLHLHASAGRGFETPTLNELSYRPDGSAGLNAALKPAISRQFELGLKWRPDPGQALDVALFDAMTRDELVVATNVGGRATFRNAARTQRRGAELGWTGRWSDWRARLALTWLDARYRDDFLTCSATPCTTPDTPVPAGRRLPGVARHSAAATLDWAPPHGWRAGAELRQVGAVPVNDTGSDAAAGHTVVALHGGYAAQGPGWTLRAFARVDNLLDRRYAGSVIVNEGNGRWFEPAPGRTLFVGLDGRWSF
jgi:iron complex outermembrane receptor protein